MKLIDLKKTKKELKPDKTKPYEPDPYGYGTRITLDESAIEKLGLKMPKVGEVFKVEALACVRSTRSSEGSDYDSTSIELQITDLGLDKQTKSGLAAVEAGLKDSEESEDG